MGLNHITEVCRRLSCGCHGVDDASDDRPETPLWGTSRPVSSYSLIERIQAKAVKDPSPPAPARLESQALPSTPTGLRPLLLVERQKAREEAARTIAPLPGSVPMQRTSGPARPESPRSPPFVPKLPSMIVREPVAIAGIPSPEINSHDVIFDYFDDDHRVGQALDQAYDGCSFELQPIRTYRAPTQYDVQQRRYGRINPMGGTQPLNIVKKAKPVPPEEPPSPTLTIRPPTPPLPLPPPARPLPRPPMPPPRASSLPDPPPRALTRAQWAHEQVMADFRAQGHPLPELIRQVERNHPLAVWPNFEPLRRPLTPPPHIEPGSPWPLGGLPR